MQHIYPCSAGDINLPYVNYILKMKEIRILILCDDIFYCEGVSRLIDEVASESNLKVNIFVNEEFQREYHVIFVFVQPTQEFFLEFSLRKIRVVFIYESKKDMHMLNINCLYKTMSVLSHKKVIVKVFNLLMANSKVIDSVNKNALALLSPRKRNVLFLFSQGYPPHKISEIANISIKTVYSHKYQIMSTFGIKGSREFYFLCNFIKKTYLSSTEMREWSFEHG